MDQNFKPDQITLSKYSNKKGVEKYQIVVDKPTLDKIVTGNVDVINHIKSYL